jgi:phosphate uptake regulator
MGETTLTLFDEVVSIVSEPNPDSVMKAGGLEVKTDDQHRLIHDQCLRLITLQAPVVRDARFVTGVLDAIVDLELIADYSYEIGMLVSGMLRQPPLQVLSHISTVAKRVHGLLAKAVDAWRREDLAKGVSVRPQEIAIRRECGALHEELMRLTLEASDAGSYLALMLVARHLERILHHAACVVDNAAGAVPVAQAEKLQVLPIAK